MSVSDAQKILVLRDVASVVAFAGEHGWPIENGKISFSSFQTTNASTDIPASKLIHETLSYAKELEKIV